MPPTGHQELRAKRKLSMKTLIRCAATAQSLEPFVDEAVPPAILKHIFRRVSGAVCMGAVRARCSLLLWRTARLAVLLGSAGVGPCSALRTR